ncbi:fumarylacetoacetate hydrolase family protein [Cupriavidus pauculus]|uniref:2-hydroxyhepta-2,4-diene-1,7-dioate isomerase n=1 Tax=Cupriavidus pauculus TaxID=82633 RepID=A0A2N5C2L6_9BURK|nr:fumarylacetoacetate hydrolase family protein [Cupriavidus pauculus]PLP96472.1 2-hydroxyhepta-2,4-diene-1,7-dioate isomerase [Cupriavidus pauculus]
MKLVTFLAGAEVSWGAVIGQGAEAGVIDLARRLADTKSVKDLLAGGEPLLAHAKDAISRAQVDHPLASVQLLPPIPDPEKIFCIGVNYAHRNAEYKDNSDLPKYPSVFMRTPASLTGHGQALLLPPESKQLDYEGEIGIVIGKTGRRIDKADAHAHIAGLTCINEGTIRDWLHHGKFNVTQGKNFDASGAIGPWVVTADEFSGFDNIELTTRVNGEVRQHDTTANLMFPFDALVAYLSQFATLNPGDVIATGTPIGAGVRFDPPRFLVAGDVVEVDIAGVGVLSNVVRAEEVPS